MVLRKLYLLLFFPVVLFAQTKTYDPEFDSVFEQLEKIKETSPELKSKVENLKSLIPYKEGWINRNCSDEIQIQKEELQRRKNYQGVSLEDRVNKIEKDYSDETIYALMMLFPKRFREENPSADQNQAPKDELFETITKRIVKSTTNYAFQGAKSSLQKRPRNNVTRDVIEMVENICIDSTLESAFGQTYRDYRDVRTVLDFIQSGVTLNLGLIRFLDRFKLLPKEIAKPLHEVDRFINHVMGQVKSAVSRAITQPRRHLLVSYFEKDKEMKVLDRLKLIKLALFIDARQCNYIASSKLKEIYKPMLDELEKDQAELHELIQIHHDRKPLF